jgi:hypothetical protein
MGELLPRDGEGLDSARGFILHGEVIELNGCKQQDDNNIVVNILYLFSFL